MTAGEPPPPRRRRSTITARSSSEAAPPATLDTAATGNAPREPGFDAGALECAGGAERGVLGAGCGGVACVGFVVDAAGRCVLPSGYAFQSSVGS